MRVVFALVSFVFSLISMFAVISKMNDVSENTKYTEISKIMTVKEKTDPKGFSVIMVDSSGKEYKYEKNWCNNHLDYYVGSKHTVKIQVETYQKKKSGYSNIEITEFFKLDCK